MRTIESVMGSLLWVAVALLLPMTALEPVAAVVPAPEAAIAVAACDDGSPRLAMGCASAAL